ncbi:p120 [Serratia liquefaciens]|nr:p120 [Serratia liquefaciens]
MPTATWICFPPRTSSIWWRSIREQVINLTGQRYLDGYNNDEEQFKALMGQGLAFSQNYNLKIGVALTPEQMALLTQDILWLVNTTVTLPDGSQQNVLVPQVYARIQPGDLEGSGALIAGRNLNLNLGEGLFNSGHRFYQRNPACLSWLCYSEIF